MTREQKLLALDAALCALEGDYPPAIALDIQQMSNTLDAYLEPIIDMKQPLNAEQNSFLDFTSGVREDFHEPDEQGISFEAMVGQRLDNAMGIWIDPKAIEGGYQEAVIVLTRSRDVEGMCVRTHLRLNLATLLGWARSGLQSAMPSTTRFNATDSY